MPRLLKRSAAREPEAIDVAAGTLVAVGALNWGLVGLFGFDLVAALLGRGSKLSRLVYTLVGASAVYLAVAEKD